MKNLLALLAIFALSLTTLAAQNDDMGMGKENKGPIMTFETTTVDYGTIEQNSNPLRTVKFTNTGDEPLIVKHAKGSCGCTVPKWPEKPIMPGESDEIEVRYDTKRIGSINKTVKITTNEGGDPHILRVKGKVLKKDNKESLPKKEQKPFEGQ